MKRYDKLLIGTGLMCLFPALSLAQADETEAEVFELSPFVVDTTTDGYRSQQASTGTLVAMDIMEVPMDKNDVPHYLPGENPFIEDYSDKFGLPFEAVFGGAETMYPEYMETVEELIEEQAR